MKSQMRKKGKKRAQSGVPPWAIGAGVGVLFIGGIFAAVVIFGLGKGGDDTLPPVVGAPVLATPVVASKPSAPEAPPVPDILIPSPSFDVIVDDSDDYESRLVNLPMNPIDPVSLLPQGEGWKVDVPTLLGKAPQDYSGELIELPQLLSWHEKVTGLAINATGTHAAISYQSEDKHNRVPTRVVMADLRSGHVFANHKTGGALVVLALSDDASTLVMRSDGFGSGKKDRLELWNVTASAIQKGPAWIPYGDRNIGRDVQFASFAADGKLITSSAGGQVIAWTVSPLKAEWTCNAVEGCSPAMALGREHLLLAHNDQLCLLDLTRLQVIAAQPAPPGMHPKLSFSPQATRIGVGTLNASGVVYDTATGAKYREIARLSFFVPDAPIFVSEDQILITNMYLIDLPSQVPLWKYSFVHAKTQCGQAVWCVNSPLKKTCFL